MGLDSQTITCPNWSVASQLNNVHQFREIFSCSASGTEFANFFFYFPCTSGFSSFRASLSRMDALKFFNVNMLEQQKFLENRRRCCISSQISTTTWKTAALWHIGVENESDDSVMNSESHHQFDGVDDMFLDHQEAYRVPCHFNEKVQAVGIRTDIQNSTRACPSDTPNYVHSGKLFSWSWFLRTVWSCHPQAQTEIPRKYTQTDTWSRRWSELLDQDVQLFEDSSLRSFKQILIWVSVFSWQKKKKCNGSDIECTLRPSTSFMGPDAIYNLTEAWTTGNCVIFHHHSWGSDFGYVVSCSRTDQLMIWLLNLHDVNDLHDQSFKLFAWEQPPPGHKLTPNCLKQSRVHDDCLEIPEWLDVLIMLIWKQF